MAKQNEYVKVTEASLILAMAQNSLMSWAEAGKIPMHKNPSNGYSLFRRSDLERFLAKVATPSIGSVGSCRKVHFREGRKGARK